MIVNKLASSIFNDILGGLAGIGVTTNMSIEQLEDEIVDERLLVIKKYAAQNLLPVNDLQDSLNCIEVDCKNLNKCCDETGPVKPTAHFEIPQIVNDFGESAISFIGTVDKSLKFKVYTNANFRFHKYKMRRSNKPYVFVDTSPNENNMYDCFLFNAPMLERVSVTAVFKDPRQVQKYQCCNYTEADNLSFIASEVRQSLILKKLQVYRTMMGQTLPNTLKPQ